MNVKLGKMSLPSVTSLMRSSKYYLTEITNQLNFTPKFYQALGDKLQHRNNNAFLRLEIFAGEGCEGFAYKFKFDDKLNQNKDFVKTQSFIDQKGTQAERVLFAVNKDEIGLLKGATLDYAEQMMRQVFYVKENPNAEIECSCKTSFSPKAGLF